MRHECPKSGRTYRLHSEFLLDLEQAIGDFVVQHSFILLEYPLPQRLYRQRFSLNLSDCLAYQRPGSLAQWMGLTVEFELCQRLSSDCKYYGPAIFVRAKKNTLERGANR